MMNHEKLDEFLLAEPFRPLRIGMASGQSFEVRHPEMLLIGRATAKVYTNTAEDEPEKWHDASMVLIETIETFDAVVR